MAQTPQDKVGFLLRKFEEVVKALRKEAKEHARGEVQTEGLVGWATPREGWVVLNTDGA